MFNDTKDGETHYCAECEERQRKIDELDKENQMLVNQYNKVVEQNKELQKELNSLYKCEQYRSGGICQLITDGHVQR